MISCLIYGAAAAAISGILWVIRIPQVLAFLVAGAAQPSTRASQTDPGDKLELWEKTASSPGPMGDLNAKVMITYHAEYHAFDPALALSSLSSCIRLGAGWIRADIRWNRVLPDGLNTNARAIAWYRRFLATAQECGLKTMIVLSTPPNVVRKSDMRDRHTKWRQLLKLVVSELGAHCDAYQVMNEPNNPVYGFFPRPDSAQAVREAMSIIRSSYLDAPIAINISMDIWGWREYLEALLLGSDSAVNIVGLDHYPGTWTVGWGDRWNSILELANNISNAAQGSVWSNRSLAIFETGYCTNTLLRDEQDQASYFQNLGRAVERLQKHKALSMLGIYELCDGDSGAGLNPEAHFGVMTSDLRAKPAFETVAELVRSF